MYKFNYNYTLKSRAILTRPMRKRPYSLNGLVLYLPLWHPELTGTPIISKDLNALSCAVTGAVWGYQGRIFDGTDDKISISTTATVAIPGNAARTFMGWMKVVDLLEHQPLVSYGEGVTGKLCEFIIQKTTGELFLSLYANNHDSNTAVTAGVWNHIGFTLTGTTTVIYLNGVSVSTKTDHTTINSTTSNFIIGAGILTEFASATIGEVIGYNRVLSPAEIQNIYLATKWRYQ